jgi:F420-non-reducing hydrogenase small subunit
VIDLNEGLLEVADAAEIAFWPVALDFKLRDVEKLAEGEVAASFINGAVRTGEQEENARLLREKSGLVIAFGSCAHLGGVPGLANLWDRAHIFDRIYGESPSVENPEGVVPAQQTAVPEGELALPAFYDTVHSLAQMIDVDYYLPGCPPPPDLILEAVKAVLDDKLPEKGAVLAPGKALCDTCPRVKSKPDKLSMEVVGRPHETRCDPDKCFLAEGIICLGPVTRTGCGERCINVNMPCRGCMGPPSGVIDQGTRGLSAIASLVGLEGEERMSDEQAAELVDQIVDPTGTFYRFSLPSSMLRRRRME